MRDRLGKDLAHLFQIAPSTYRSRRSIRCLIPVTVWSFRFNSINAPVRIAADELRRTFNVIPKSRHFLPKSSSLRRHNSKPLCVGRPQLVE